MSDVVLCIGATLFDSKGKPVSGLEPGTSNPATIRITRGGTARNVAENLARLGADVRLLSAVGEDESGERLLRLTADAGVNLDLCQTINGERTGGYMAILAPDGTLSVALDDVSVMRHITPGFLHRHRRLFKESRFVVVDGSLSTEALATVVKLARQYDVPLCADPSSARLAHKLRPHLDTLRLVVPNEVEAAALFETEEFSGFDPEQSQMLARRLVRGGVGTAVVTLSDYGIAYATSDETGYVPSRYSEIVDSTGTGDAVTAAIIFGLLNEMPTIEAIRLGAAAAGLTVQTTDTVVADLSLDMLYDHLIV